MNVVKGPPEDRFMKQRNKLHHPLEEGITEAIMGIIIKGMGMSNYRITWQTIKMQLMSQT